MMKYKKIILLVSISVVAIIGIIFGVRAYNKSQLVAEVQNVALINMGYYQDTMQTDGMVTNDKAQSVYVDATQVIKEVHVTQGQQVNVGDAIISFDMESLNMTLDRQRLEVQRLKQTYEATKKELDRLRSVQPVKPVEPEDSLPPKTTVDGMLLNYLDAHDIDKAKPNEIEWQGKIVKEYQFDCSQDAFLLGSFINKVRDMKDFKVLIRIEGTPAKIITEKSFFHDCEDDSKWELNGNPKIEEPSEPVEETYTQEELKALISKKESELKEIDLNIRQSNLVLSSTEKQVKDGTIYAEISGTVKTVGDVNALPNDGSAFISIVGSDGLYVKADISELWLDKIKVGQEITASSWETGLTYQAKIQSIDTYPNESPMYWGMGNPNCSYYSFTAYIENADDLKNGQYLSLSFASQDVATTNRIYLESSYIREENGKSYVMKDSNGKLVKQYVTTGQIVSGGYAIEIKAGLTEEDYIAFPYGKTAQEGVKTNKRA